MSDVTQDLNVEIRWGGINGVKKLLKLGHTFDYNTIRPLHSTNFALYCYLTNEHSRHSKRQQLKMYYLLTHHGLDIKKPWRELYKDVDPKNNLIFNIWRKLFQKNCFQICIALHELPALQTMEICKATHPYSVVIPEHFFWKMATIIKHFKN